MTWVPYLVVALVAVGFVVPEYLRMRREEKRARELLAKARAEGTHEPASIRPHVDLSACMGSAACVRACPEQSVLELIDGQANIVKGSYCVGHGACERACPVDAIQLVFGSEKRGVDLPQVRPDFQTNVKGLYIAGELGGMGLIANAVRQGVQAVDNLAKRLDRGELDLVIVGAGPAGLAAGLRAKELGLSYVLLEQDSFGGAIRHYPRQKLVMTRPMELPLYGTVKVQTIRKEALVELLEDVVAKTGLEISAPERVDRVDAVEGGGFLVVTDKRELRPQRVLLSVGRRGTPRRLDVPGEDQSKVAYRLVDPELYQHDHVLVVGGGDSALEAACELAEQPGNTVTLSYRGDSLSRPKAANRERLAQACEEGRVRLWLGSTVRHIGVDRVTVRHGDEDKVIANDYVFVFAGGILPTKFLANAGIQLERHFGRRVEEL